MAEVIACAMPDEVADIRILIFYDLMRGVTAGLSERKSEKLASSRTLTVKSLSSRLRSFWYSFKHHKRRLFRPETEHEITAKTKAANTATDNVRCWLIYRVLSATFIACSTRKSLWRGWTFTVTYLYCLERALRTSHLPCHRRDRLRSSAASGRK